MARGLVMGSFFGPGIPVAGVADSGNPSTIPAGAVRRASNAQISGIGRLEPRGGTEVAMTLLESSGGGAVTSVRAVVPFGDGLLAVAHSTSLDEVTVYRLDASLTGFYDATGAFTTATEAEPCGTLWTSIGDAPDVTIAEYAGVATIAHTGAATVSALSWPTKTVSINATTGAATVATLTADLDASGGAEDVYFSGTFVYQQHLWGWGFNSGTSASTAYAPELLRHGGPLGQSFTADGAGSFTIGTRVKSARERIVGAVVAQDIAYIGTNGSITAITGFGRDTFRKDVVTETYGFTGPKSWCAAGQDAYGWTDRGPARVRGRAFEPLWDAIPTAVASVVTPAKVVAVFDADRDQVQFVYDTSANSGRQSVVAAFDVRREVWLGADGDLGAGIACAGRVQPVVVSTASATPPAGAPTSASTSGVGASIARANWANGDTTTGVTTTVEVKRQADSTWTTLPTVGAGVTSRALTGLIQGTPYEWRAKHTRTGLDSGWLGPVAGSQFTTSTTLNPPTSPSASAVGGGSTDFVVTWTNAGESSAETEVEVSASSGSGYVLVGSVPDGVSSATVNRGAGTWYIRLRHTRPGTTSSSYTAPVSVTVV